MSWLGWSDPERPAPWVTLERSLVRAPYPMVLVCWGGPCDGQAYVLSRGTDTLVAGCGRYVLAILRTHRTPRGRPVLKWEG